MRPMPAATANWRDSGTSFRIFCRRGESDNSTNAMPAMNTAVRASCQLNPMVPTTEKAKNALSPIPGATTKGNLAMKHIISVAKMVPRAVAVKRADSGMPDHLRIAGFTARTYTMDRKVVMPAETSTTKETPLRLSSGGTLSGCSELTG